VLFLAQTKARADLADICEGGISVYLDPLYLGTSEKELEKFSARFEVRFQLPGEQYQSVVLQGAIRYGMRDTLSGRYRIGMQLYPTGEARELISRYVKRRQAAALQEIKNIYEKSLAGGKFV